MKKALVLLASLTFSFNSSPSDLIGTVKTKGLIFKDEIKIEAFDDPTIEGVTCYVTYINKALSFDNGSNNSIACRQTGKVKGKLTNAKNVFSKKKNLFFKNQVVDRFYDKKRNVLVYVTYVKNIGGKNFSHSISVVKIE